MCEKSDQAEGPSIVDGPSGFSSTCCHRWAVKVLHGRTINHTSRIDAFKDQTSPLIAVVLVVYLA